jgi:hypothetical protein
VAEPLTGTPSTTPETDIPVAVTPDPVTPLVVNVCERAAPERVAKPMVVRSLFINKTSSDLLENNRIVRKKTLWAVRD